MTPASLCAACLTPLRDGLARATDHGYVCAADPLCDAIAHRLNPPDRQEPTPMPTTVCPGCDRTRPLRARGVCSSCYARLRRHGTLDLQPRIRSAAGEAKREQRLCVRCQVPTYSKHGICPDCADVVADLGEREAWVA